ncbi:MAG: phosphatidylserine decarboxylase [Proteobacteria bacterium]|nr:phosphatidylserine decarboxylase [Pseudomonadota bacterium]
MKYILFKLLPKNLLSRIAGYLADKHLSKGLLLSIIHVYANIYKIRLDELKIPVHEMSSFNQFFTRELKKGLRPIDRGAKSLISPVDGTIAEFGKIESGLLVQTKGILYSLYDLVGDREGKLFEGGQYMTIYLSPANYHRIHFPVAGSVKKFSYFSGNLWPVNNFGVNFVGGLFALNERIVTPIECKWGIVGVVKVGATIVGKIKLNYDSLESNNGQETKLDLPVFPPQVFKKGAELGRFQLGSTVILLFQKNQVLFTNIPREMKVKMGQKLGEFI